MQFPISIMIVIDCFFFGFYLAYYSLLIKAGHHFFRYKRVFLFKTPNNSLCVWISILWKIEKLQVPKKKV